MGHRTFFALAAALFFTRLSMAAEPERVLLLGDASTVSEGSPPGLRYADWIRTFLEPHFSGKIEVANAGVPAGGVKAGREAAKGRLPEKPVAIVLGFGLDDALKSSPEDFIREYEGLLDDIARESPSSRIVIVTSIPLDEHHRLAGEERFRKAGGIGAHLVKGFVDPLKDLAAKRKLALAGGHALMEEAFRSGEKAGDLIEGEDARMTDRGNLLLGRFTSLWILHVLGKHPDPPSFQEAFRGDGDIPILPPPPADLGPALEVWTKDLEPLWISRLKDEDPDVRLGALKKLAEVGTIPESFLAVLFAFLEPASGNRNMENEAGQVLVAVVQAGLVSREKAASSLLGLIRKAGVSSREAATAYPLLEKVATGQAGPRPGFPTRVAPAPRAGPPVPPEGQKETPAFRFADGDLDLFASALASREQALRSSAENLLIAAGEPGVRRILAEAAKLPEKQAIEPLDKLWQSRAKEDAVIKDAFLDLARRDAREGVKVFCLDRILGLPAPEIPLELLKNLFAGETGDLQLRSAQILAARGREGLETLISSLGAAEEDRVQLSRTALFYMGLYGNSDEVGKRALAALLQSLKPEARKDLLGYLEATFQKTTIPLACIPAPDNRRAPVRPIRGPAAPRPVMPGARGGQPGNWPVESNIPRVDRLKDFLPRLETILREGIDEEKEAAERLLQEIWQKGREIEAAAKAPRQQPPLAQRLQNEAWEALKRDDAKEFLMKARQAVAAGASAPALRSFAWKLATTYREDLRDPREAEGWAREAISRSGRGPTYLDALAACLAAQGKFKEALDLEVEALQGLGDDDKPAPYIARSILYLSGKPFGEPAPKRPR